MKPSTFPDDQLLHNAASGKARGLADWIEVNNTLNGIPIELIVELIRNSRGCKKDVLVSDVLTVKYAESLDENGNLERYISKKTGVLRFYFKGSHKPVGRPKSAAATKKRNEIMDRYEYLRTQKKRRELAYSIIAREFNMAISSIESIIKQQKKKNIILKKQLQKINPPILHQKDSLQPIITQD